MKASAPRAAAEKEREDPILLDVCAVCATNGNSRMAVYWLAAAVLTASVTY